eukprot:jgi/Psemu1/45923/gm1.45923_g
MNSQQKLHQQIFMEHIPYVFCEIFVTDPELLCNKCVDEWLSKLTLYRYLPESGNIFTPLTPSLAKKLVEWEKDVLKANLQVLFLSRTSRLHTEGTDLYLSGVFKHLEGSNCLYYTLSDLESWDCFFDSKEEMLGARGWYSHGWLGGNDAKVPAKFFMLELLPHDDDGKPPEDKGNESDEGNMDKNGNGKAEIDKDAKLTNNGDTKPVAKNRPEKELVTKENYMGTGNDDKTSKDPGKTKENSI